MGTESGDRWVEARSLTAISVARSELDEFDTAAQFASSALEVARDLGDQFSIAVATVQLGRTLRWRRHQPEALTEFTEAAAIFEEIGARWELADALYARGSAYEDMDRLDEAEADLRSAVRLGEELGARALTRWTTRALMRIRARREERQEAAPQQAGQALT